MTQFSVVGRPRSVDADERIMRAALDLYGEAGWYGFNLTNVAKRAGVGKSTMYARWNCRGRLLIDSFNQFIELPPITGTTVRQILRDEVIYRLGLYFGEHSKAIRRILVEMNTENEPALIEIYNAHVLYPIRAVRDRLWILKNEGDLSSHISVTRLLDAIEGSTLMRALTLHPDNIECFKTEFAEYADDLVDDQLYVIHHSSDLRLA
ncbi:TetR family transcriptional regulator [Flaviflexus huanghaiensis]|uniref:TetR family transcriptional regulator n=1 Tax=Flaviflexus huanghaiensis TaxID=1111473 RepID=UPI0015FC6982